LARDYAQKRQAFGANLARKPLHIDTLAAIQAEFEAAFMLSFFVVELMGKEESGDLTEEEGHLLRLLTSINKLITGKQAVAAASEVLEAFGGAGYVEDTGLPLLLRDSQVLPIWEGTTNVLSLDALRALTSEEGEGLRALKSKIQQCAAQVEDQVLEQTGQLAQTAVDHAEQWLLHTLRVDPTAVEAGARRFALTLGRALELALLTEHAQWSLTVERDGRAMAAARRFAQAGIDLIGDTNQLEAVALANDLPLALA
ncbi:MAG: acyl-CoA dehydrogenase family protein, partial [Candidatus Promineifilaceae bacterium]